MSTAIADIIRLARGGFGDLEMKVITEDYPTAGKTDMLTLFELALSDLNSLLYRAYALNAVRDAIDATLAATDDEYKFLVSATVVRALRSDAFKKIREGVNINTTAGHIDASERPEWYLKLITEEEARLAVLTERIRARSGRTRPYSEVYDPSEIGQKEYFPRDNDTSSPYRDKAFDDLW